MFHDTILKYIALIQSVFNGLRISHIDDHNRVITKNIPMIYGRSEKAAIANKYSEKQLITGNTHVIPYGFISLDAFSKADDRSTNKNRIVKVADDKYSYNSVPYDFVFSIDIRCRGDSEAYQIVEQVAPMFNPTLNLDVWDSLYKGQSTRVAVTLDGIDVTLPEYEESSDNIYEVSISCTLRGWIYSPVYSASAIHDVFLNITAGEDNSPFVSVKNDLPIFDGDFKFDIIDIIKTNDIITTIIEANDSLNIKYKWDVHGAEFDDNGATIKILKSEPTFTVVLTVQDQFNNFRSISKQFNETKYL